ALPLSHGKSKPGSVRRPGSSAWCDTNPTPVGLIADEYRLPGVNSSRAGISNVAACWAARYAAFSTTPLTHAAGARFQLVAFAPISMPMAQRLNPRTCQAV